MPVLLFLIFYNLVDIKAAVLASTLWSIRVAISRRRSGLALGWWLPGITVYLLIRSGITILVDEELVEFGVSAEAVYFGISIGTKILVGVVFSATVMVGRPLLAWLIPKVVRLEPELVRDPRYVRTMGVATMFVVAFELVSSAWDIWLYNNSGVNTFVLTRSSVNFIVGFLCITGGLIYIDRRLAPMASYPGLGALVEKSGRKSKSS